MDIYLNSAPIIGDAYKVFTKPSSIADIHAAAEGLDYFSLLAHKCDDAKRFYGAYLHPHTCGIHCGMADDVEDRYKSADESRLFMVTTGLGVVNVVRYDLQLAEQIVFSTGVLKTSKKRYHREQAFFTLEDLTPENILTCFHGVTPTDKLIPAIQLTKAGRLINGKLIGHNTMFELPPDFQTNKTGLLETLRKVRGFAWEHLSEHIS